MPKSKTKMGRKPRYEPGSVTVKFKLSPFLATEIKLFQGRFDPGLAPDEISIILVALGDYLRRKKEDS